MNPRSRRAFVSLAMFVATAALGRAHPGHDGHELTWDFSHLAAHPIATTGCAAVLATAAMLAWKLARRTSAVAQSFRGSQRSRGK